MSKPDFLPDFINLTGEYDQVIERLYSVFETDLVSNTPSLRGRPIHVNCNIKENGQNKEEGFWHLVKSGEKDNRQFDPLRAKRINWISPLISQIDRDEVLCFDYDTLNPRKGIRTFIWLKDYDYLVILKKFKYTYCLITAFFIGYKNYKKGIQDKYDNRISEC